MALAALPALRAATHPGVHGGEYFGPKIVLASIEVDHIIPIAFHSTSCLENGKWTNLGSEEKFVS
jgi:hypothetical protein